jgi:hypothetical protein
MMDANRLKMVDQLAAALALMDTHTISDVIALAQDRRAQIWDSDNTLVVTELMDFPLRKVIRWWVVAGTVEGARSMQPRIDKWALEQGATRADMIGRRGWRGVVNQEQWKHVGDYWRKELI